ncbi:MAG: ribosylnicotinamide kinase [Bathelium mastoideum]|nr:MAG: ribosylnicotinamide kinase [Bathelium mastoideum]KAI9684859.1 MAG: ribosylnicotinamide kinase [Bathelium mastoideum]
MSLAEQGLGGPAKALLIALSGPSSSGKTTLARLLKRILPNANILHQDDFYLQDSQIPYRSVPKRNAENGSIETSPSGDVITYDIQDWDCVEALDIAALYDSLVYAKEYCSLPNVKSIQDQNPIGPGGDVDPVVVEQLRQHILKVAPSLKQNFVVIIDGFMLFTNATRELLPLFDLKLLLRSTFLEAKRRREARAGYVTHDSFWEDPPFYVDDVVWPNYAREHAFLFENADVESELNEVVCRELGIDGMPKDCEGNLVKLAWWAVLKLTKRFDDIRG